MESFKREMKVYDNFGYSNPTKARRGRSTVLFAATILGTFTSFPVLVVSIGLCFSLSFLFPWPFVFDLHRGYSNTH